MMTYLEELELIKTYLNDYTDESKIWVYLSEIPMTDIQNEIQSSIDTYTNTWTSHGSQVKGKGFLFSNHFIILIADISQSNVSGCSTDSSVNFIKKLGENYGLNFFNRECIATIKDQDVKIIQLKDISNHDGNCQVFNPFFNDLKEWRANFIQNLCNSKYKRFAKEL